MTGPDGFELSDRWEEALILKAHARRLWAALDAEAAALFTLKSRMEDPTA